VCIYAFGGRLEWICYLLLLIIFRISWKKENRESTKQENSQNGSMNIKYDEIIYIYSDRTNILVLESLNLS